MTPFAPLPVSALRDRRLSRNDVLVLASLHYRNGELGCFPSRENIAKLTGLPVQKISVSTTRLVKAGWVEKKGREYILHAESVVHNDELGRPQPDNLKAKSNQNGDSEKSPKPLPESHQIGEGQKSPKPLPKSHQNRNSKVTSLVTHKRTEENIREQREDPAPENRYPEWLNLDLWREFRKYRGKKFTKRAEALNLNRLIEICPDGRGHEAVIEQTIERGWSGLFALKGGQQPSVAKSNRRML